jgi:general secretion pathway protein G
MKIQSTNKKKQQGFTIMEVMIAIAIGVTIIGILVPTILSNAKKSSVSNTQIAMQSTVGLLEQYKLENGAYPSTNQGLQALVSKPSGQPEPRNWRAPYTQQIPKDAWNNEFGYFNERGKVEIISYGADGFEGGSDYDADISSLEMN